MPVPQLAPFQQDLVQETLLGEALEHGPVGAIVLDEEGRYLAANRLACKLSGYTREELLEGGAGALSFEPSGAEATMHRMASGDLQAGTADLKRKDGTAHHLRVPPRRNEERRDAVLRRRLLGAGRNGLVGTAGFEPAASRSQSGRATRLRHVPAVPV